MFYWLMKYLIVGPFMLSVFRPWVRGRENVPESGPVIFASNHLSFIDSVFLPLVVDRPIRFLAKSEYFTGRGAKGWLIKRFFLAIGQLPIDRSGGKASEASLNTGLRVLADGLALGAADGPTVRVCCSRSGTCCARRRRSRRLRCGHACGAGRSRQRCRRHCGGDAHVRRDGSGPAAASKARAREVHSRIRGGGLR